MDVGGGSWVGHPTRTVVSGPLALYADGFRADLTSKGYALHSIGGQMRLVAHLSSWMEDHGCSGDAVDVALVEEFLRARRAEGFRDHLSGRSMAPVLEYLRGLGVAPTASPVPGTAVDGLLAEFGDYLVGERGLAEASVRTYRHHARPFLVELGDPRDSTLVQLSAGQVTAFMVRHRGRWGAGTAKATVTALRSLLRFLHASGRVPVCLAAAVPAVPGWKACPLPPDVNPDHVAALLAGCDRRSTGGRRDYAILLLLARLGLRAGEVAAIDLDHVDWRGGELLVRGKGSRREQLPLPVDVGEALADYVRYGRPRSSSRRIFLILRAPFGGLPRNGVFSVVARACRRVGVPPFGPHRLRHAVACDLLRRGASLAEVAELMRHRDQRTTAIYAKVDLAALRDLARPCLPAGAL